MKKIISMLTILALLLSMTALFGITSFAATTYTEKYADITGGTGVVTDNLSSDDYTRILSENLTAYPATRTFTRPCVVYFAFEVKNADQKAGPVSNEPMSLNYEVNIGAGWIDSCYPMSSNGGDFEYQKLEITKDMITAAGGTYTLTVDVRAEKFPAVPISDLDQTIAKETLNVYEKNTETLSDIGSNSSRDVNATYVAGAPLATVYSVDVTWGSMDFTFTDASKGIWNPATHTMDNAVVAAWSWEDNANLIKVTNHSNAAVNAILSFGTSESSIDGNFFTETKGSTPVSQNTLSLATAVGTAASAAPSASAYLQITGAIASSGQIGTVTVTLQDNIG